MPYGKIRPLNSGEQITDGQGRVMPAFAFLWQQLFGNGDFLNTGKQDADPDLDALSDLSGTGLVARTGDGTYATRTLQGGAGVTITNPAGIAGDPLIEVDAAGGTYIPLVDGAEPPTFITDGAGQLILVPWSPL